MTNADYCERSRAIVYTASLNQHYHQQYEWICAISDRCIRATVLILTIIGAILAVPQLDRLWWAFGVAVAAALAAAALNFAQITEKQKFHDKMFHLWSDLGREATAEANKVCEHDEPADHHAERLNELADKTEHLHTMEMASWNWLLNRCQEEINEREWGRGIRTNKQIELERARRQQATSL